MGRASGLVTRLQQVAPLVNWTHCTIQREAAKQILEALQSVLYQALQIIHFVIARPLNSRLFRVLCQEMGSEREQLHALVRWISRGREFQNKSDLKYRQKTWRTHKV